MGPVFRWDPEKARSNLRKHGVTFEEAASAFRDIFSVTIGDPLHSTEESRFVTIGRSDQRPNLGRGTLGFRGDDSNHQRETRNPP
jgi:uncharacterized DUF497 family protein